MVDLAQPAPARLDAWKPAAAMAGALLAVGAGLSLLGVARLPGVQNFFIVFASLLIEAVPFILLVAAVSALIEVFVPARAFDRLARLPRQL